MRALAGATLIAALPLAAAATDFTALSDAERAAFRAEVRAALLAHPEIVARALEQRNPVQSAYRQQIDDDLSLLGRIAPEILAGRDIALFVGSDCADCADAIRELEAFSEAFGATFILRDMADAQGRAWAEALELDGAPFYVLTDMVLRGHMPPIVLGKYLGAE
ncbi:disulfide bond formation protein DsbA [Roseovarius spongiae]|uniref:Disulfide bond formation protein DsbA n=1 Tax=Roseovarius spongiae TaxID=2320272 RepID=A0A3A8B3F0_9RHOB|nr:disulfide bond formation protein DsbA [Roseovarius spongiae]RKF15152.1 disulfide bond formation protein DsbA [Roseovarius spongiae]